MNKKSKIFITISFIITTIASVFAFLSFQREISIKQIKESFKLMKNPEGTQKLPETKNTDKTLSDLEKDILENNK